MIGPSRRQQPVPQEAILDLELHKQLARRRIWHRRLSISSVLALLGSVVAWLSGSTLPVHAGIVFVGFVLGLFTPLASYSKWALEWIAKEAGLSYHTALEKGEDEDRYGFLEAVRRRAFASTRHVTPPPTPAWWLPVLAISIGLLLLPAVRLGSSRFGSMPGAPFSAPTQEGTSTVEAEEDPEAFADRAEPVSSERPETERVSQPGSDQGGEAGTAEGESDAAPTEFVSEQETLNRFLANLRERQPDEVPPSDRQAPSNLRMRPGDEQAEEDQAPTDRGAGETREGTGESETGSSETAANELGGEEGEGTEGEGETAGEGESAEEGSQSGPGEAEIPQADSSEGEGEQGSSGSGPDEFEEQGFSDAAGNAPSGERPIDAPSEQAGGDFEFLPGRLGFGPQTSGGAVRLPGSDQVEIPLGSSPGSFQSAIEKAVTEGDIPVDYQEIIRNYFR
ncbi:MAG: hypothetical protein JSV66_11545 [Trueperaceae bacterium]|nr:MAG: hypothetical protein JSV66_11545 [Trueperaceae bacterium]